MGRSGPLNIPSLAGRASAAPQASPNPGDVVAQHGRLLVALGPMGWPLVRQSRPLHRADLRLPNATVQALGLRNAAWLVRCDAPVQVKQGECVGRVPSATLAQIQQTALRAARARGVEAYAVTAATRAMGAAPPRTRSGRV